MNGRFKPYEVFRDSALPIAGGPFTKTTDWPVGKVYHWVDLFFDVSLLGAAGAASGAISDGLLNYIKAISFKTPKNEYYFQNVPGRLAYVFTMEAMGRVLPRLDVPADPGNGVTAVKRVMIRIPFHDMRMYDPSDFLLNSFGLGSLQLDVTVGTISDLFTTVSGCTISASKLTAVAWFEDTPLPYQQPSRGHSKGVQAEAQVKQQMEVGQWYLSHLVGGFGDPTTVAGIDLIKSPDISVLSMYAFHGEPTGVSGGQPFSGTPDNIGTRYTDFTMTTDVDLPIKSVRGSELRDYWQANYSAFSSNFKQNTYWGLDFASRGQKQAAQYSGDKSVWRMSWTLPASGGASAGSQLSIGMKVWRKKAA